MKDPDITLHDIIQPALNKLCDTDAARRQYQGDPRDKKYRALSAAAIAARNELILSIKKYLAEALALAGGYEPVAGHVRADGMRRMKTLDEVKRAHIQYALARFDTMDQSARALGIDIATLFRMRKRWGMRIHEQHSAAWAERKLRAGESTSSDSD